MVGFGIKFLQVVFFISASYAAILGVIVTFFALLGVGKVTNFLHSKLFKN